MSHLLQQSQDAPLDSQSSVVLQQDSPTIGRTQHFYSSSSNTSPSPSPDPPAAPSAQRSQRKAAPSPLHTSTVAVSPQSTPTPTQTTFVKPADDSASRVTLTSALPQPSDKPRSPKERLNDLLASERSFYRPDEDIPADLATGIDARVESTINAPNGSSRSVSDPLMISKAKGDSPTTTRYPPMASNAPQHRVNLGKAPIRNSSIDSAISTLSAGNGSQKPSQDAPMAEEDIAKLVQAAGSSEAVIKYLLKEKSSLGAQNAQLWRLVDKQRAMILGLNKDLERALKDKERYRKKLKETLATTAPSFDKSTTSHNPGDSSPESRTESQQGSHVEVLISAGLRDVAHDELPPSPVDVALAPYPITPPPNGTTAPRALANMTEAEQVMPVASAHAFQNYDSEAADSSTTNNPERKLSDVGSSVKYNASVPPSRSLPADPPVSRGVGTGSTSTLQPPKLAIIEATPNVDEGLSKFPPPPTRKGPPAPLDLGASTNTSAHLHQADSEDDSDYDDVLEVDKIPAATERGRRKTREEDDREREMIEQKNAEIRSLSKKSKSSKSRPTTPKEAVPVPEPASMPAPVRAVGIQPPETHSTSPPSAVAGSLAGMLTVASANGPDHKSDKINHNLISLPPMSPGLPVSPRPQDRGMSSPLPRNPRDNGSSNSSVASPPLSPRGLSAFPSMPLSPRAPRQPIPLPPNTPMSLASPGMPRHPALDIAPPQALQFTKKGKESTESEQRANSSEANSIYQGFVSAEHPDLLLPPNALPSITVQVASSRLKPSRASLMFPMKLDEDPVFTLAIISRSDSRELWLVEKDSASLAGIDQLLKQCPAFTAKAPDKSLFNGHAPAKIDARRLALDKYLDEVMNTPFDSSSALELCKYLSTNAMPPQSDDSIHSGDSRGESPVTGPGGRPIKNGYLTKRGKNFGGWKARFFVLDGPILKYYEAPGGVHLGSIKLPKAEIGKQAEKTTPNAEQDDLDNQYRHAFLIMEPKKKDSSSKVRHVLCAESDKERDQWVAALLQYVDYLSEEEDEVMETVSHTRSVSNESSHTTGMNGKKKPYGHGKITNVPEVEEDDDLKGISYEATTQGSLPQGARPGTSAGTPSPPAYGHDKDPMLQAGQFSKQPISGPKNATLISDTGAWGNKSISHGLAPAEEKKQRKRSFFGFGSKPRPSTESEPTNDSTSNLTALSYEQHGPIRACFGAPLVEAVKYNHPADVEVGLPAVVYRCIEYLEAKNAAGEEGIFRLSGSNVVIKQLRERFNVEGDVNLITDEQYYDIHAVASLLKLYLRELPTTILTRELHLDFVAVTELRDVQEKIFALNGLVHRLPVCNLTLLRYLSRFLIDIINHSDVNKMTVRNVGIVFSPTLNIPAPVFALFIQQFEGIFEAEPPARHAQSPVEVIVTPEPLTPDDIRSPRRQQFQELPTPSYQQQSFPRHPPSSFPMSGQGQQQSAYETGFTPLQPTYETHVPTLGGPEYGSRSHTIAGPSYDQYSSSGNSQPRQNDQLGVSSKAKRRESSMFSMGLGNKKPSYNKLKDNSRIVEDESFFD